MAMAYLARWQGPINEEDNPYPYLYGTSYTLPSATATVRKHVQNAIFLPYIEASADDPVVKEAVMTYGAIYIGMRWCSCAYNETRHSYYYDDSYPVQGGHIVCVVGWDDDYPASNFNKTAPGNGAWIVRNSWGTSWGENGYFYVSYYDIYFGKMFELGTFGPVLAESTDNYTSVYQYDPLGWVTNWGYKDATAWGANIFTAADSEPVIAVSFYAETANTSYEIYVYEGVAAGKPRSGNLQCSTSGTTKYAGYYTIDLPASVPLSSGQKFSVVVKFTTPGYGWPIPVEDYYPGYTDSATASPGQSFINHDGELGTSWQDVSANSIYKANICIKAFTGLKPPAITVMSPALNDSWFKGGVYSIFWTKNEDLAANVAIQLMHGTTVVKTIANPTPNDGSYGWKIPRGVTPRSDYFVRVKTMDGQTRGDSALFSIVPPYLTVTSPGSDDTWYRGEIKMIMWSGTGTTAPKVTVQLMHGSTVTKTIALDAPNSGSYSWKIQKGIAFRTDYFIKIKTNDGYAVGNSAKFAIRTPSITIASPTRGTS